MTTYHATEPWAGTKCLICGSTNLTDALLCGQCSAPLAIVHDVAAQERERSPPPRMPGWGSPEKGAEISSSLIPTPQFDITVGSAKERVIISWV